MHTTSEFNAREAVDIIPARVIGIATILACLLAGGCNQGGNTAGSGQGGSGGGSATAKAIESRPLESATATGSFVKVSAEESGIDFVNELTERRLIVSQLATHSGLASGDIDMDGDLDLFICGINSENKLYRNEGGWKFTDITKDSSADLGGGEKLASCAAFADVNGDGFLDLYVGNADTANDLFLGDGKGGFTDAPEGHGTGDSRATTSASFFDCDEDGDLDLYICNYADEATPPSVMQSLIPEEGQKAVIPANLKDTLYVDEKGWPRHRPDDDAFLINDGNGKFTDETEERGLQAISYSFQAQAFDFNNDGFDDLFITSDFETPDRAMLNDGTGHFSLVTAEMFRKTALYGMGADSADVNNDGLPDLFVADMSARGKQRSKRQSGDMYEWRWEFMNQDPQPQMRNMLYVNTGGGWMSEVASMAGVKSSDWTWATRFADLDCDGYEDLYTATGFTRDAMDVDTLNNIQQLVAMGTDNNSIQDFIYQQPTYRVQDYLFQNNGDLSFSSPDGNWGLSEETYSAGATLADFDNDGDADLIINQTYDPAGVYRNDISDANRLAIDLRQEGSNSFATGARVWAHVGDMVMTRDVIITRGFATGEAPRMYFGLGNADRIDRLEIRWPDNKLQVIEEGLDAGMHYTIHRNPGLPDWQAPTYEPYFNTTEVGWEQQERNTAAVEFDKEPLLPFQQSTLGTGVAATDSDGDGNLELLFGGAAGQDSTWIERSDDGSWEEFTSALSELVYVEAEITGICVFDANADGRRDVLLCTGGIEGNELDGSFRNYLLIATDDGWSTKRLPTDDKSAGKALAADFDRDGDLDLLIAGHVRPYQYGRTERNYLLVNDGDGNFTDRTEELAQGFATLSQVADAVLHDMDGDGWQDMVLARHWGPVEIWLNIEGNFLYSEDITERGWWRGLAVGDFNNDQKPDVIACNAGENTKYHPSMEKPQTTFCNDFDGNGTRDIVEASYNSDGTYLPGRGRSCSGYAIRTIPRRFPTWTEFSNASLQDVYGDGLEDAEKFYCDTVDTVICLSEGDGWNAVALEGMVQWTPAFSAAVADYDNDGNLDAFFAGNFTQTQPETGEWDSGYGTLLMGNGDGSFREVSVPQSGIRIYQDQRGSIATDIDLDGNADLVIAVSNGHPRVALGSGNHSGGSGLNVRLNGSAGNPDGLGAKLVLTLDDGSTLQRTAGAAASYFAASTAPVHFGIPAGRKAASLAVEWADGTSTEQAVAEGQNLLEVSQAN